MANETKIRNGLIIEGTLVNDEADRILVIDPTTGLVGYRAAIDLSTLLSTSLAQYGVLVGDAGGEAAVVDSNSVGDILVDETNGLTLKAGAIVNADVNASAAIAYSKLALTGGIVNADVNASAAIAYSKLALTDSILNADINSAAAIARTKLASGNNYRIIANNSSGVMSENAAITASRAVVSDTNGQLVAQADGTTAAEVGYLNGVTGPIQTQLDSLIATQTVNAIIQSPTTTEDGYAITWDDGAGEYTLTDPVTQGIPVGGTTRQFLGKNSGTNYDASWLDLVLDDITDISALAADLNLLAGLQAAGLTTTELGFVNGVTSAIQTQLDNKLSSSLSANSLFIGSAGNVAIPLAAGSEGYVLSISGGIPSWISPTAFSAEAAQDAVGGILDDGTLGEIVFTYDDGAGTISATMENDEVIAKVLTGYSASTGTVAATDTILEAIQKVYQPGATDVAVADGGTALSAISALSILVANSANTFVELTPGAGNAIRVNAGGTAWEAFTAMEEGSSEINIDVTATNYSQGVRVNNTADAAESLYRFLFYAGSSASGNQDLNGSMLCPEDSVTTITIYGQGVAADGSAGISVVKTAAFRRDGSADIVQIGTTTTQHSVEDSGDTPTITLTTNGTGPKNIRVTFDSNSVTVYHWTIWVDVAITKV